MIPGPALRVECDVLFVYGTLRRGFKLHHHLERLGARFLTEGKVGGELFDLGRYPGARPISGKGKWVHGELFQLRQPAPDLKVLDEVEDFNPAVPERSEFVRDQAEVTLPSGSCTTAWVYWLTAPARLGRRQIASGDYAGGRSR